ncbi:MAG: hypothetical protein U1E27_13340, partial [Kiritimatiellia bacterium]|nr:hypothetical protein [Kiritimatiellia bacterium]
LMGYLNIRRARGPREKRHVRLACFAIWGLAMVFLAAMLLLDSPYREIVGGALFLLIPLALFRFSTRHQLIRKIEAREQRADPPETP